jgi:hypothetical protein
MMKGQARLSGRITGFDTHLILEPCLLRIPATEPDPVINQPSRHYAGTLDRAVSHMP